MVKLSGGRSSAMMLAVLLENRILEQDRGDVVVFNNTGAEHPATYDFVSRCKELTASYGIGFFHTQFQTYEDARRGEWVRIPAYRLVNERAAGGDNEDGLQWRGEPYEELVSWSGYIPNQFARSCTQGLKIDVTKRFVADWLKGNVAIPRIGHHGEGSRIDRNTAYKTHRANRGAMTKERFESVRSYVWSRPHMREEQAYQRYGGAVPGTQVRSEGYVALIGLRADEQSRAQRMMERSVMEPEAGHVYLPLWHMGIAKEQVDRFWEAQEWNLGLGHDTKVGNCVYCFMKGKRNLGRIAKEREAGSWPGYGTLEGTPSDPAWWSRIEHTYARQGKQGLLGFFGANAGTFAEALGTATRDGRWLETMLPCDCTD